MQNIEFYENFFIEELTQFFDTLKKTEVLHKYDVKFTVRPKNNKIDIIKKRKLLKK